MLNIKVLPTNPFQANCYVMWPDGQSEALVVDPGPGTLDRITSLLETENLRVGGVLLTHGHFDHIWETQAVLGLADEGEEIPVYMPGPDMFWLDDPTGRFAEQSGQLGLTEWVRPEGVKEITNLQFSPSPGINLRMIPAPGHSPGASVFLIGAEGLDQPLALSGDVVFQGSVGRTDLPGGDQYEMSESLRTLAASLDPETTLLPGHGPSTTWRRELDTNPYVQNAIKRVPS